MQIAKPRQARKRQYVAVQAKLLPLHLDFLQNRADAGYTSVPHEIRRILDAAILADMEAVHG